MPPPPTPPKSRPTSSSASSVGSCRSQADEARRHAGGRTSGNGPDTTERAPLDARGWVPSVFRARPANDKESGRAMPATPRRKVDAPCRRRPEERSVDPAARVHDGAPGRACSRWSPRRNAVPSPRGKGAKGKSRAKASRRRVAAAKAAPKLKAVLSGFWAIFHAGNSHFRANKGGAARYEQPGVRIVARGGARVQRCYAL